MSHESVEPEFLTLTEDMIRAGGTKGAGWNRAQFLALGIPWPARTGWIQRAVGRRVRAEDYRRFLALCGSATIASGSA